MADNGKEEIAVTPSKGAVTSVEHNQAKKQQQAVPSLAVDVPTAVMADGKEQIAAVSRSKGALTPVILHHQVENQQLAVNLAVEITTSNQHSFLESVQSETPVAAEQCIEDGKLLHLQTFLRSWNAEIQGTSNQLSDGLQAYRTELLSRNHSSESNGAASVISHSGRSPEKNRYEPLAKRYKQQPKPKALSMTKASDADPFLDEEYKKLMEYGLHPSLVVQMINIYKSKNLKKGAIDVRALRALKELPLYSAQVVLKEFLQALSLPGVNPNKSALLCETMTKVKKDAEEVSAHMMKKICERTGYPFQDDAEEKVYGPPTNLSEPPPGCEIQCSEFPKDAHLDELILLCEDCGAIYELRLFMEPISDKNQGYACVKFTTPESAQKAVKKLNGLEIREGLKLQVDIVVPEVVPFGSGRSLSSLLPNVNLRVSDSDDE